MIIGLSGRMGSGKTLLSTELINKDFVKVSFADHFKRLLSDLYNFDLSLLYTEKGKSEILDPPLIWNVEIAEKLFKFAKINDYNFPIYDRVFNTRRECIQYIGTEILKKYDSDFHIKNTISLLSGKYNYICDDIRFPDELEALKNLGAHCYYILRPDNFNVSNHESEISLNWSNFKYHIINNLPATQMKNKFLNSLKYIDYIPYNSKNNTMLTRDILYDLLKNNHYNISETAKQLKCSEAKIVKWSKRFFIDLPRQTSIYDRTSFLHIDKESAYYAGLLSAKSCIKKIKFSNILYLKMCSENFKMVNGLKNFVKSNKRILERKSDEGKVEYIFTIKCPYIIENLKYWNLKPGSKFVGIPRCLENNEVLKYWLCGVKDGNGKILEKDALELYGKLKAI